MFYQHYSTKLLAVKILHVIAGERYGAVEAQFANLACYLEKSGNVQQQVILAKNSQYHTMLVEHGIKCIPLDLQSNTFDLKSKMQINRSIKQFKPDIVQSWLSQATRVIPYNRNYVHIGWLRKTANLASYSNCDYLITLSQSIVNYITHRGWQATGIKHIKPFASNKITEKINREDYNVPKNATLLVCLGEFYWRKGFDIVIMALQNLPNVHLWLLGEGDIKADLRQLSQDVGVADRVHFLGWREDRLNFLYEADMCIVPSRHELFGLPVIESWAQKTPLIATKVVNPHATVQSEVDGLFIAVDDVDALVEAVQTIKADDQLRDNIIKYGYKHYQTDYSISKVVAQFIDYYHQCLKNGKTTPDKFWLRVLNKLKLKGE